MKRLLFSLVSVFCLSLAASLAAAAETAWPQDKSDLRADPDVIWGSLPNGLRYAIMKHQDPSEPGKPSRRVTARLYVRAGSLMERDDQQGLAHFLEHMAFRGTKHFPAGEMIKYFQRLGMGFVSDTNAETNFDRTVYKLELPENSDAYLDDALTLFRDFADGMLLEDKEINKERGVIINEKVNGDSVGRRASIVRSRFDMPEARLADRLPIGSEEVIRTAGREKFLAFYKKWYVPERMTVVIAGPVDPARLAAKIVEKFGSMQRSEKPVANPDFGKATVGTGLRAQLCNEPAADSAVIFIENYRPADNQPETVKYRRADLVETFAQVMLNQRLQKLTAGDAPKFLGAQASREVIVNSFEGHRLTIVAKMSDWQSALAAGEQELRRAAEFGFSETEFRDAKQNLLQYLESSVTQADSRLSSDLADGIVSTLAVNCVFTDPRQDLEVAKKNLAEITVADCAEALRRKWLADDLAIFVYGNLPGKDGNAKIKETFLSSRRVQLKPPVDVKHQPWAYTDFGAPGRVVERREVKDLGLTLVKFSNNVRLNLKQSTLEKDSVGVVVSFGSGKLVAPKNKPGLVEFASDMYISGGLEKHSFDDVIQFLTGRSASAIFTMGNEFCQLSGATNRKDIAFQMQLLCAYLKSPGFRGDRMQVQSQQVDAAYESAKHELGAAISTQMPNFLFQGDVRLAFPARADYKARTMAEVKDWLSEARESSWLEIGIVGDFDQQATIDAVAATFGALPARADSRPDFDAERHVRKIAPPIEKRIVVDSKIPQAAVFVLWPTTDARGKVALSRQCSVLANILSERMRVTVREELGKTYTPQAVANMSDTFIDDGAVIGILSCEASQAQNVSQIVTQLAAKLAADGATADELERARRPILSGVEKDARDNGWWMNQLVATAQSEPHQLDEFRNRKADYEAVDLATVNRLAKKYLTRDRAIVVLAGPDYAGQQTAAR